MKTWPALDLRSSGDPELVLAALHDYLPTAIEERDARAGEMRAFFVDTAHRDAAVAALASQYHAAAVDVPDDDWARRSQEHLKPVTVGLISIFPDSASVLPGSYPGPYALVIRPSMGFGTGHHATTRLCLSALQALDLTGALVIDIGTGSGVLALAARLLGAREVLGIDTDPDAIQSAEDNLTLNPRISGVRFEVGDLRSATLPRADVVTANLTGTLLAATAADLLRMVGRGGTLIISGVQDLERAEVLTAFSAARLAWESEDDGWVGAVFVHPISNGSTTEATDTNGEPVGGSGRSGGLGR
jgi:ribosomal protein L11 methyltransferase